MAPLAPPRGAAQPGTRRVRAAGRHRAPHHARAPPAPANRRLWRSDAEPFRSLPRRLPGGVAAHDGMGGLGDGDGAGLDDQRSSILHGARAPRPPARTPSRLSPCPGVPRSGGFFLGVHVPVRRRLPRHLPVGADEQVAPAEPRPRHAPSRQPRRRRGRPMRLRRHRRRRRHRLPREPRLQRRRRARRIRCRCEDGLDLRICKPHPRHSFPQLRAQLVALHGADGLQVSVAVRSGDG